MGTEAWQKGGGGGSEDRLTHYFVDLLEANTGVPGDCLPAAMDDGFLEKESHWGGGGGGGSTEVDLVVVVVVVVAVVVDG